ncbi:aminotransferase class I/II-fold pyridoxal phosphate-dependent enzyme [Lysinibacter cavernae]|uniref:N-succinyldiaminopimelate aminotransferase n=1 Tax=Lysinibacter cavernae TaxID=1640652 RepID=A0A7X5QYC1_9MICO|nr:aminotransferase class I/II-fold pyridoxal phosphate-dependent enzyme [Lysinibacter cavernae]NIH52245.1 N-succinyldiaminopimelate aminotransferase [Lysinibacter cavernae]
MTTIDDRQPPISGAWSRAARGAGLLSDDGQVRPTIFAEMSALAASTGSLNLGQGFPDEDGPVEVTEAARAAISEGHNQYPPGRGIPDLLSAISEHQQRFYGITIDPDTEVLVTTGATEALAATLLALLEPGDEVVTLEPYYDAYGALIRLAGATHRTVALRHPHYLPSHADLTAAITDRTRLILLNTPHNPCGSVMPVETLEHIVALATANDAIIVTDEVYEHLTFGVPHIPIASLSGAAERTVTISSGGKTFNTTGWKVGWLSAPSPIITAIQSVKQFLTYTSGAPFQPAMATGLRLPDEFFTGAADTLRAKRDLLSDGLRAAGFDVSTPSGGYFVIADAAPLGFTDAVDLCRKLPELAGVVGVPVAAFCSEDRAPEYSSLVRFAYCKRTEVLEEAAMRLSRLG